MSWHYLAGGQPQGPIDDSQFAALVQNGTITADTPVWRDGMADWKPYRELLPAAPAPRKLAMRLSQSAAASAPDSDAACSDCGSVQPRVNLIPIAGKLVCARCKQLAVQRLRESVAGGPGNYRVAGLGVRLLARILDTLVIGGGLAVVAVGSTLLMALFAAGSKNAGSAGNTGAAIGLILVVGVSSLLYLAIPIYCLVIMPGSKGGTPGKLICGLRIIRTNGQRLGYWWAIVRIYGDYLSVMLLIGLVFYIVALFDDQKRTLADRLCGTRVVKA